MELSDRLLMVASMVEKGSVVADVGCDHGYVSIYLIRAGISPRVLAMDVNVGPLERAREHVEQAGLASYIQLRLSDGLREMRMTEKGPEADTLLAAGIGGRLAARILKDSVGKVAGMKTVILQPQSEPWLVRQTLRELDYHITDERMVKEEGKFYTAIRAENGRRPGDGKEENGPGKRPAPPGTEAEEYGEGCRREPWTRPPTGLMLTKDQWREASDRFGPVLMRRKDSCLAAYLEETLEKHALIRGRIRMGKAGEDGCPRLAGLEKEDRLMRTMLAFIRTGTGGISGEREA